MTMENHSQEKAETKVEAIAKQVFPWHFLAPAVRSLQQAHVSPPDVIAGD